MKQILIASIAHAISAAYCSSLGDNSQPAWADAPDWQKQSAVAGVAMHIANPDATPEQSHESWLAQKVAEGWVYGETKDADLKQHPCVRPYAELPPEQKAKDYLFRAVVHALKGIETSDELVKVAARPLQAAPTAPSNTVAIEYIGKRDSWTDHLYQSGLEFVTGQVRNVPNVVADKLLRHIDLFERATQTAAPTASEADETSQLIINTENQEKKLEEQRLELDAIDLVNTMDKNAVHDYGVKHYGIKINKSKSVENMRAELAGHISQVGLT